MPRFYFLWDFCPQVLAALSALNAEFFSVQLSKAAIFFLGSIDLRYNLENALREKSQNK